MPEIRLPGPLKRRDILYGPETPPERLVEYGRAYEEAERLDEALQFYAQADDREGLERVKAKVLEAADAFLLKEIAKKLPELVGEADWRSLIARAEELGKALYAEQARQALEGHLEALEPEEKKGLSKS